MTITLPANDNGLSKYALYNKPPYPSTFNLIPYFGGMIIQSIGVITSFSISKAFGIKVLIATLISSFFDTYILNPYVYGKSNNLNPIIVILSVFACSSLFGIIGIFISEPLAIIIINTIKYFKKK